MDLTEILQGLEDVQLIRREPSADPAAAFRHVMIQETAYGSLVRPERRRLHRCIGETLEAMFPDRREEMAEVLARHFDEAGDNDRAMPLYAEAADRASARTANPEAAILYGRALELALATDASEEKWVHLGNRRGRSLELSGQQALALQVYEDMVEEGQRRGSWRLEMEGLIASASLHAVPTNVFDPNEAMKKSGAALELARKHGDRAAESRILWTRMRALIEEGAEQALAYGEESLKIARDLNLWEQVAFTLNDIHAAHFNRGQFDQALAALEEARDRWTALDNLPMLSDSLISMATLRLIQGEFDEAYRLADEGRAISERIGNVWGESYARMPMGMVLFARWELGPAIRTLEACLELGEQAGFLVPQVNMRALLAVALGLAGDRTAAFDHLDRAFSAASGRNPRWQVSALAARAWLYTLEGKLAAAQADLQAIEQVQVDPFHLALESGGTIAYAWLEADLLSGDFQPALERLDELAFWAQQFGLAAFDGLILTYRGVVLRRLGRTHEAREALHAALERIQTQRLKAAAWRPLRELADLEEEAGHIPEAERHRQAAAQWLQGVAEELPDPVLRRSFESGELYRSVLRTG